MERLQQQKRHDVTCDNPLWIACMWGQEHLYALWLGRTLSHVPWHGTPMRDQLLALFPFLFGGQPTSIPRPIYTPQETYVYGQTYEVANLTPRPPPEHFIEHEACGTLLKTYMWIAIPLRFCMMEWAPLQNGQVCQGIRLPRGLKSSYYGHGLGMINFCMRLRSCICFHTWGAWMGLQDHRQHHGGSLLPDHLNDVFVYVALRLQADRLHTGHQRQTWRVWNRRFCDFFVHSTEDIDFTDLELSTTRVYFTGKLKSSCTASLLFHLCPRQSTVHPETGHFRFYHAFLQSEVHDLVESADYTFPMDLELRTAPHARL